MMQSLLLFLAIVGQTPDTHGITVLDFYSKTCPPCRVMRPRIKELVDADYPVKTIDIQADTATASQYKVTAVPTVVIVDRDGAELKRFLGPQEAKTIAVAFDREMKKAKPSASPEAPRPPPEASGVNPKPWETVVRIRVIAARSTGFGSGTVIASTANEAIVVTCAHIFRMDGRKQAKPADFPLKIQVDCFDGVLKGTNPAKVTYTESFSGKAIDYDFARDVGLIRVTTNHQLPATRVVPANFTPTAKMKVFAVGCPEGRDATTWATVIRNPRATNFLSGTPSYEAIECDVAPKEGRSGGGLYTTDHYLVGVCNFAEPQGNHGLYATPQSIYGILDRNSLQECYAPISEPPARMLASSPKVESVEADPSETATSDVEQTCLKLFKRWGKPKDGVNGADGQPGAVGPTGPAGTNGKDGRPGRDGNDGQPGRDGQPGKDGVGGSGPAFDPTDILKRLAVLEADNKLLKEEAAKPITVKIKSQNGKKYSHDFKLRPNQDGQTGIGANFPPRVLGIDISRDGVPVKAPSTK